LIPPVTPDTMAASVGRRRTPVACRSVQPEHPRPQRLDRVGAVAAGQRLARGGEPVTLLADPLTHGPALHDAPAPVALLEVVDVADTGGEVGPRRVVGAA